MIRISLILLLAASLVAGCSHPSGRPPESRSQVSRTRTHKPRTSPPRPTSGARTPQSFTRLRLTDDGGKSGRTFSTSARRLTLSFETPGVSEGESLKSLWILEKGRLRWSESTLAARGEQQFSVTRPAAGWPAGRYRVDLYLAGEKVDSLAFTLERDLVAQKPRPSPVPSTRPEPSPTSRPGGAPDYAKMDSHALEAPASAGQSVEGLARYLVKPATNDHEKARAIYRWITENIEYDTVAYFSGNYPDPSAEAVLKRRQGVCGGYANLFEALGKTAGLEVEVVPGFSKGYGFTAGDRVAERSNHAWNAVKLDGAWYLVDSTWGAGNIDDAGNFIPRFTDFWFLAGAETFIYDHLPDEPRWQLLPTPVSRVEFEKLARVNSSFFTYGLGLKSHPQGSIRAGDSLTVELTSPADVGLLANLEEAGKELEGNLIFVQQSGTTQTIRVVFPRKGRYTLRIFARKKGHEGPYEGALEYAVEASSGQPNAAGFPEVYSEYLATGATVRSPLTGRLRSGVAELFELEAPGAAQVMCVDSSGKWTELKKTGNVFRGKVTPGRGDVKVMGRYSGGQRYSGLLRYSVE